MSIEALIQSSLLRPVPLRRAYVVGCGVSVHLCREVAGAVSTGQVHFEGRPRVLPPVQREEGSSRRRVERGAWNAVLRT